MTPEQLTEMLARHAREIGEHVDAVQIVVTRTENENCGLLYRGCGNLYARLGACQEFLDMMKAGTMAYQHRQIVCPQEGDP